MPEHVSISWWYAVIQGLIEGMTEFLPISSTGHLLIAQHWLPKESDAFNVIIQSGAILAVVFIYWNRIASLFTGLADTAKRRYLLKLIFSFLVTAVGGLGLKKAGWKLPEEILPVAIALAVGGVLILLIDRPSLAAGEGSEEPTWNLAFWIGAAQVAAAVFPGLSRSGATILMALVWGMKRRGATEYSFLLSVPTMFAAGALEGKDAWENGQFTADTATHLAIGFLVSMVTAFICVKWLLRFLQSHTFRAFGWYRIALALALVPFIWK